MHSFIPSQRQQDKIRIRLHNVFRTYRLGKPFDERNPEHQDAHVELPLSGEPDGPVFFPPVQPNYHMYQVNDKGYNLDLYSNEAFVPSKYRIPWRRSRMMRDYFEDRVQTFQYDRTLGWGGNGMAAVFDEMHNDGGGKWRSVVVKMLFSADEYKNAEHIVQLLYNGFENEVEVETDSEDSDESTDTQTGQRQQRSESSPDESNEDSSSRRKRRVATGEPRLNCFVTEMLENGDLSQFIAKVRQNGETVPNVVLWRFLLCLVRMCIGLAYPPDSIEQFKTLPPPITENVPLPEHNVEPRRICHFDFDPRNIFIGDIATNAEHRCAPILKLGDFGLATEVLNGKENFYYERLRYYGKRGFYAPEQFCEDWDYIDPDDDQVHLHRIAGNYGMHTNLWAVGLVMETLITLCYPASPPTPTLVKCCQPPHEEYYTYGAHLQEARDVVDPELIEVVMRLQAHEIKYRYTFEQLSAMGITDKGNFGWTDQRVLTWFQKVLHDAPLDRDYEVEAILANLPNESTQQPQGLSQMSPQQQRQPAEIIGVPPVNPLPDHTFKPMGNQLPDNGGRGGAGRPGRRGLRSRYRRAGLGRYNDGQPGPVNPPMPPRRVEKRYPFERREIIPYDPD
ncbi:kinase-like domain-containing protein [Xylaria bambusicola]|uniref:kinase-like domain-containing protein n=1 Tax=Xylaria bambusicola TaxID=326684 RepID=UPI0020073A46|nr:kinase-like domain-containing protein [Xylaria bambusicola]KAI0517512.1 kinase-like domain-containing protein [Xylaria bambusicola]